MVDNPAAVDLARARNLLNDLAHLSPALAQMVELAQRDPKSGDLTILGEKREKHRGGGSRQPGHSEAPTESPRIDLRRAPRVRPPSVCSDHTDSVSGACGRLCRRSDSSADREEARTPRSNCPKATQQRRRRHPRSPSRVVRRGPTGSSHGHGPRSQRQRNRPRTWRRPHDGHTIAGASSRSAGITIAHHPDPVTERSNPSSGNAITIALHVGNTL